MRLTGLLRTGLLLTALAAAGFAGAAPRVEITEVKNVGVSAGNEARSVIQVRWAVTADPDASIKRFDVALEVTYADGAVERARATADGAARSARVEVPTLHLSPGRPGAALKGFKASVVASFTGTATRQGNFE